VSEPLRAAVLEACLDLNRQAMAIFDAVEAGTLTMDTARAVVAMGEAANEVALAVRTLVVTGGCQLGVV